MVKDNREELKKLQKQLDDEKWYASEKAGMDLCGRCQFCDYCDKYEEYPCAHSSLRAMAAAEEEDDSEVVGVEYIDGCKIVTRLRRSFMSRLIQNADAQKVYTELKNCLTQYNDVTARVTFKGEGFRIGKKLIAKIAIRGKGVYLYLALNPKDFENTKYIFVDESAKKSYVNVPMKLRMSSERAIRWAKELIAKLAKNEKLKVSELQEKVAPVYEYEYENDEQLFEKGLIKKYVKKIQ